MRAENKSALFPCFDYIASFFFVLNENEYI